MKPWDEIGIKAVICDTVMKWGLQGGSTIVPDQMKDLKELLSYDLVLRNKYYVTKLDVLDADRDHILVRVSAPGHNRFLEVYM